MWHSFVLIPFQRSGKDRGMKLALFPILAVLVIVARAETNTHSAINPVPRKEAFWAERAKLLNDRIAQNQDTPLLFIGDSITQGWEGEGKEEWEKRYAPRKAVNLGIGGDRTQHVLYRLQNGNLNGVKPKAAVVMIGTNNSNGEDNTASQIADGVAAITKTLREKTPDTRVLLLAIFPRGENINAQRGKLCQINQILAKLDDGKQVRFLDIGHRFLNSDGLLPQDIMPDYLHLSPKGYAIWADAIESTLAEWLGEKGHQGANAAAAAGDWIFTIRGPNDEDVNMAMKLKVDGGKLSGEIERGPNGWLPLEGTIAGEELAFTVKRDRDNGESMTYSLKGQLKDNSLAGKVTTTMNGESVTRDWKAKRK